MLNEVKPNLGLLMSIRLGLAEQYGIPLDVPFRDYKAWYRWTGMEVPTQHIYADFVNQLYSKDGKPCRFEDIFEFERLSKAWLFDEDGLQEWDVDEPRFSNGLFLEPEATNYLLHSLNPMHEDWRKGAVRVEPNDRGFDVIEYTDSHLDALYQFSLYDDSKYDNICRTLYTLPNPLVKDTSMQFRNRLDGSTTGSGIRYSPLTHTITTKESSVVSAEVFNRGGVQGVFMVNPSKGYDRGLYCRGANRDLGLMMTYYGAQVEGGSGPSSLIETADSPTTRLRDSLSTTIPQGHTITGDWDDTLHLFERDGQLDFEGYGYIRTLEIIRKV